MIILNYIPLIGAILAFLLGVIISVNKNQSAKARLLLTLIVAFNAHSLLESYLFYNDLSWPGLGLSYLHYHLIGPLFLLYADALFRFDIRLKSWVTLIVIFTALRLIMLSFVDENILETATSYTIDVILLSIDNILSLVLNIWFLSFALIKIRKVHFAVKLSSTEELKYRWMKSLIGITIGLYGLIFFLNVISMLDEDWLIYFKIESVINTIFTLALVYSSIRFPIFSVHGDFKVVKAKYAKSSLKEDESKLIWESMIQVMTDQKPYLNSEYRLNDLAEQVGRSVHHVSQTINEQVSKSFSDFINEYRVEEAKRLLNNGRTSQVTILAVSFESGFNSKTAFYNTFKKMTGKTPTQYLKEQS
ncbi:helix-turn-helix domain-containing protein [Ekhidna sp.]